jgi:hypothetical protein
MVFKFLMMMVRNRLMNAKKRTTLQAMTKRISSSGGSITSFKPGIVKIVVSMNFTVYPLQKKGSILR